MKLDERTVIGNKGTSSQSENSNSNSNHHQSFSNSHTIDHFSTFDHSKSPPRAEADHSDRSSHYAHIPSQSADSHFNRQKPISLEGISLNEREKKWWDEVSMMDSFSPFAKKS
jgi:hydrogenase maturation factor HypF (carbamoyltransferase family)